jgi:hypothetical protein
MASSVVGKSSTNLHRVAMAWFLRAETLGQPPGARTFERLSWASGMSLFLVLGFREIHPAEEGLVARVAREHFEIRVLIYSPRMGVMRVDRFRQPLDRAIPLA